jgi:hypothetical protein
MKLNNTFEITDATDSHSKDTGALVLEGGVGIEKNLNVGGNFNVSLGSTFQDLRVVGVSTLAGLVFFENGILVNNVGIASNTQNEIKGIAGGDLVLTADSNTVQVDANLTVDGSIVATQLNVDQTRLNGNTLETVSGNNDLTLQAHGTGVVGITTTVRIDRLQFDGDSNIYLSVDTDLSTVSSNDDTLASARSIQNAINAVQTDLLVEADNGAQQTIQLSASPAEVLTLSGTANEIVTTMGTNSVTFSLPDDVTIGNILTVSNEVTAVTATIDGRIEITDSTIRTLSTNNNQRDLILNTVSQNGKVVIGASGNNNDRELEVFGVIDAQGGVTGNLTGNADTATTATNVVGNANRILFNSAANTTTTNANLTFENNELRISDGIIRVERLQLTENKIENVTGSNSGSTHHIYLYPKNNGDVFIGQNTNNALQVRGDIIAFHSSDVTLKENVTPIPNALDKVLSLSGNTYTWIKGSKYEGQDDTGVIAQEVDALGLPGLATTREDGKMAVRYEKLIPVLIEAIKELKSEIEELKK